MSDILDCDVLVIGAGIAGGVAALKSSDLGAKVILVSGADSASSWAQGGIVYKGQDDPQSLIDDIMQAGCARNYPPAVEVVAMEGPRAVDEWLRERLAVKFDIGLDGNPDLTLEAAHNSRRILHVRDFTGAAISERLVNTVCSTPNVECRKGVLVELLLSNRHDERGEQQFTETRVRGAYVFDSATGQVQRITARSVILATGGYSQLYLHSTGPESSRGDGIAAAHRAGARSMDLEFVQFHPTALYLPGEARRLLTEALRGSGAKLLGLDLKSFVDELAPRDVVARAIHDQMIQSAAAHVWMDLRPVKDLETKFPAIMKLLRGKGFDPLHDLIPVVPAAHYTIGGVWSDLWGGSSLPGLYAVGEVACTGLHGANRLASTSLLEGLVFGERAAIKAHADRARVERDFRPRAWRPQSGRVDPALLQQDWQQLRQTLWNYIGLVRSPRRLARAEKILVELRREIESFYRESALSTELIGLRNGVLVGTLLLYAALRNQESLGTHYLRDEY